MINSDYRGAEEEEKKEAMNLYFKISFYLMNFVEIRL